MEKYTIEQIRRFLHYVIDHMTDKRALYNAWVRMEKQLLEEMRGA